MPTETPTFVELTSVNSWRAPQGQTQFAPQHMVNVTGIATVAPTVADLPGDRLSEFVAAVHHRLEGQLVRCEERYPSTGHHSVLYVVVEKGAGFEAQLNQLQQEFFGADQDDPLAPVRLVVVDRDADAAMQKLMESGLTRWTGRTSRTLWPTERSLSQLRLSPAEIQKSSEHRMRAAQKLKVARVLADAGLLEDARTPILEAMHAAGRALAVEQRLPEPEVVYESLLPPFARSWGKDLAVLRRFATDSEDSGQAALETLSKLL